jgi:hypothetical protein
MRTIAEWFVGGVAAAAQGNGFLAGRWREFVTEVIDNLNGAVDD